MAATDGQHKASVTIDARVDAADREIKKLTQQLNKMQVALDKSAASAAKQGKGIDGFEASMKKAQSAIEKVAGLGGLVALAGSAVAAVAAVDQLSQRSIQLADVQKNLRISVDAASEAAGGLVDTFSLQKAAAEALRFGIVKTSADFAKHVQIATTLARTTGKDSTQAVNDLTTALARQSPMILDNLGLQVDVTKANQEYARSIGKTASQLTDAEKKIAFVNAAYADADAKIKGLTVTQDGWAVSLQKAKAGAIDLGDKIIQLPENVAALHEELQRSGEAGQAAATAMEVFGRVLLATVTLGASEAVIALAPFIKDLKYLETFSGRMTLGDRKGSLGFAGLANVQKATEERKIAKASADSVLTLGLLNSAAVGTKALEDFEKKHRKTIKQLTAEQLEFNRAIAQAHAETNLLSLKREGSDTRDIESARIQSHNAQVGSQIQRVTPIELAEQEAAANSQLSRSLNDIEQQRAKNSITELQRIQQEKDARLGHLTVLESLVAGEQYTDDRRQVIHEAEMARIQEEARAHEDRMAIVQRGIDLAGQAASTVITGLVAVSDARQQAITQAKLQGKTEEQAAKAGEIAALQQQAANLMSIRNQLIGLSIAEGVKAIAAAASFNYPGAALHTAAAIAAAGAAATVGAMARSKSAAAASAQLAAGTGLPSVGSSSSSSQSSSNSSSDIPGSNSSIPGSPNPEPPSAANSSPGRGSNVYDFRGATFHTYGLPPKEFIRRVTEGQKNLAYEREPRKAG